METGYEHSTHPIGQEEGFKMQDKWKFLVFEPYSYDMGNAKQEDILRMLCPWKNQCFNKLLDKTGLDKVAVKLMHPDGRDPECSHKVLL